MLLPPPLSTVFPYTTLSDLIFRCGAMNVADGNLRALQDLGEETTGSSINVIDGEDFVSGLEQTRDCRDGGEPRSEEHTSELQSRQYLVCRLLLEKKKIT